MRSLGRSLQDNEKRGARDREEEEEEEEGLPLGEEETWEGEWRTSVMAGNENSLFLKYKKRNPKNDQGIFLI